MNDKTTSRTLMPREHSALEGSVLNASQWMSTAFSELIVPVIPTTSMVAVGLLNTGKYEKSKWIVGDRQGDSKEQESSIETFETRSATPAMITFLLRRSWKP
jgi:hypothetical protein